MTIATPLIEVSDLASQKLEEILNEQGETGALLRMMVVPGPHGSFQYMLGMEREAKADDLVVEAPGVQVLVDPESAPLVEGAQIDYVDGLDAERLRHQQPQLPSRQRWWWLRLRRRRRLWRWWWLRRRRWWLRLRPVSTDTA